MKPSTAKCACLHVEYKPKQDSRGYYYECWKCPDCESEFARWQPLEQVFLDGRESAFTELKEILSAMSNWHWQEQVEAYASNVLDRLTFLLTDLTLGRVFFNKKKYYKSWQ